MQIEAAEVRLQHPSTLFPLGTGIAADARERRAGLRAERLALRYRGGVAGREQRGLLAERVGGAVVVEQTVLAEVAQDSLARRRIGHNLKGSGGCYGFPRMSAIGGHLESAGREKDRHGVAANLEALCTELARAQSELAASRAGSR